MPNRIITREEFHATTLLLPDGSCMEKPAYMNKPQGQWTAAEVEQHVAFQEMLLKLQRANRPPAAAPP